MTDRCDLTELLTTQCAHCLGHPDPVPAVEPEPHRYAPNIDTPHTTIAMFRSRCPQCNETINPGEEITLVGGVEAAAYWACSGCA